MFDKEEILQKKIAQHLDKLRSLKSEAKEIVQGLYEWYFVRLGKTEFPDHIRETVKTLDKFAYGSEAE